MPRSLIQLSLWLSLGLLVGRAYSESPIPSAPRTIMTWVPPYSITQCRARLNKDVDGIGPKDALTHLALQFWNPTPEGGVVKTAQFGEIGDATIIEFRDWARQHGIRTMLCVYNGVGKWDWMLAHAAFANHREPFIGALIAEMERLDLDGIDIDLEGTGEFESSKEPYVAFIRSLGERLHAKQKQLTVDTFAYKWNAPNQTWWADLFPHVDGLNSMGYEEIGVDAPAWRSYTAQKAAAGEQAPHLILGVSAAKSDWQGHTVEEHMQWIFADSSVGVAFWDATFIAPYWSTSESWKGLKKMRAGR
jgi:hypothetical protein